MKCKDCGYKDSVSVTDPAGIKCIITNELQDLEDECTCDFSRQLYDKRTNMTAKGNDAVGTLELLKNYIEQGYKRVDVKYVHNALLDVVKEGIVSDKLNEVLVYLEEFI